ncbi:mucin-2-like [Misgurnus anguillicaudatus]|uniref:mucin-2-like n=1 Tax=Misgurnus anguillicaudatus TaxID=75329 RepID=UPI003CCF53A0
MFLIDPVENLHAPQTIMGLLKTISSTVLLWITLSIELTTQITFFTTLNINPVTTAQLISGLSSQHNELVCSTWGNYHYKTFDGDYFQLPTTCNYILTSSCQNSYEDFNIQLRHQVLNNEPTISRIIMKLEGTVVQLNKDSVSVDGQTVTLPFSTSGITIEKWTHYIMVKAVFGLVAMWNEDDAFMVQLDEKYKNQTCGLCGDFNGIQLYNEFISNGAQLPASSYGNLWKLDDPTEVCEEDNMSLVENCGDESSVQ